ncbi:hypothetical protein OROMI_011624 [Orobanche minor]
MAWLRTEEGKRWRNLAEANVGGGLGTGYASRKTGWPRRDLEGRKWTMAIAYVLVAVINPQVKIDRVEVMARLRLKSAQKRK